MKSLIDKIDWNGLSCHDRALALGCEQIKENSSLFFLLFKYVGRDYLLRDYHLDIGDDKYYRYLSNQMGISIEMKIVKKDYLTDLITAQYADDERIVMVTNSINESESRMYKIENHPHFILLQKYMEDKQSAIIVDEDYTRQYWETKNSQKGVRYIKKEMTLLNLMSRCSDVNCFSKFSTNEDICVYYHLKKSNNIEHTIEQIVDQFYKQLDEYIRRINSIREKSINEFYKFLQRIHMVKSEIISDIEKKIKINDKSEGTSLADDVLLYRDFGLWFVYPYESKIVEAHHHFIYSVYVTLQQLDGELICKNAKMNELLIRYDNLKMNISHIIISPEEENSIWCAKEFEKLIDLEYALVKELYSARGEMRNE